MPGKILINEIISTVVLHYVFRFYIPVSWLHWSVVVLSSILDQGMHFWQQHVPKFVNCSCVVNASIYRPGAVLCFLLLHSCLESQGCHSIPLYCLLWCYTYSCLESWGPHLIPLVCSDAMLLSGISGLSFDSSFLSPLMLCSCLESQGHHSIPPSCLLLCLCAHVCLFCTSALVPAPAPTYLTWSPSPLPLALQRHKNTSTCQYKSNKRK